MAGYIESNLTSNEQIVLKAKVSLWSQWVMISLGILFTLSSVGKDAGGLIVIAFIFFGIAIVRVISTELALTNKRVMAKYGFIRRDSVELRLEKVEGLPIAVGNDIHSFIDLLEQEPFDQNSLKRYGLKNEDIMELLKKVFG